tara:strand:+ start:560 stop:766 length:207 start_codon:yes stop_codon:yes gene_type:complete
MQNINYLFIIKSISQKERVVERVFEFSIWRLERERIESIDGFRVRCKSGGEKYDAQLFMKQTKERIVL